MLLLAHLGEPAMYARPLVRLRVPPHWLFGPLVVALCVRLGQCFQSRVVVLLVAVI